MEIKKLNLSDKVILTVAEDIIASLGTAPRYKQFLTKHGLTYNPNDYSDIFNKKDYICATLSEVDERLFRELDNENILSDETKDALIDEGVVFEKAVNTRKVSDNKRQEYQPNQVQTSQRNLSAPPKESEVAKFANQEKTSLPIYVVVFLIVLIVLGVFWSLFPNIIIFTIIFTAALVAILSLGILAFKQDGKISDKAFVNALAKIAEMIKSFVKR